ncbi:hypothetical protein N7528_007387 [Penicillium herquei]|nr:hypothetical protein N7528_007387 [Penicillium herquei]
MQSAQKTGEYSPERENPQQPASRESSDSLYKQPVGENASYYGSETPPSYNTENPEDSERGLGSTLIGGAGGAYVGHQMGGGMATAGGAIIGALGANAVSHGLESHHQHQQQQQQYQQYQQQYQAYGGYPPQSYPQAPYPGLGYQQGMPVTAPSYGGGLFGGRFGAGRLAGQDVGRLSHCQRKRFG